MRCLASFCLVTLAACGGSGNPFDDAVETPFGPIASDEAAIYSAAFDRQQTEVLGLSDTPAGSVPTSGDATFIGSAQITVTPEDAQGMLFTGEVVVDVAFETARVGVQMTNFTGADMGGQTVRLDGVLAVENGFVEDLARDTIGGGFSGVLLGSGVELRATNGVFEGQFRDVPTTAVSFEGVDETASYNEMSARIKLTGVAAE